MEYTLTTGKKLTDEDIERINNAIEHGNLSCLGKPGEISVGRPKLSNEPLVTMTFKIPQSDAKRIQDATKAQGTSRSDFLRRASVSFANEVLAST